MVDRVDLSQPEYALLTYRTSTNAVDYLASQQTSLRENLHTHSSDSPLPDPAISQLEQTPIAPATLAAPPFATFQHHGGGDTGIGEYSFSV